VAVVVGPVDDARRDVVFGDGDAVACPLVAVGVGEVTDATTSRAVAHSCDEVPELLHARTGTVAPIGA